MACYYRRCRFLLPPYTLNVQQQQAAALQQYSTTHLTRFLQKIKEDGNYSCIYQISEHRTNDRDDKERLDCIVVLITDSTHVGHSIWSCAKTKASIKVSFNVPSNDTATSNHPYSASVSNEKMIPPLTGEGTQNFCRKATFRVKVIPTISAKAPMPAVCIMSSSTFVIFICLGNLYYLNHSRKRRKRLE